MVVAPLLTEWVMKASTWPNDAGWVRAARHLESALNRLRDLESSSDRLAAESNLGDALRSAGKLAEAADVLARVLATKKRAHGEDDADTLSTATNLAITYKQQGRLSEFPRERTQEHYKNPRNCLIWIDLLGPTSLAITLVP